MVEWSMRMMWNPQGLVSCTDAVWQAAKLEWLEYCSSEKGLGLRIEIK